MGKRYREREGIAREEGERKGKMSIDHTITHTKAIITIVVDITLTLIRRHRVCIKRSNIHR